MHKEKIYKNAIYKLQKLQYTSTFYLRLLAILSGKTTLYSLCTCLCKVRVWCFCCCVQFIVCMWFCWYEHIRSSITVRVQNRNYGVYLISLLWNVNKVGEPNKLGIQCIRKLGWWSVKENGTPNDDLPVNIAVSTNIKAWNGFVDRTQLPDADLPTFMNFLLKFCILTSKYRKKKIPNKIRHISYLLSVQWTLEAPPISLHLTLANLQPVTSTWPEFLTWWHGFWRGVVFWVL